MKYLAFLVLVVIVLIFVNGKGFSKSQPAYSGSNTAHKTMQRQVSQYKKALNQYKSSHSKEYRDRLNYKANRINPPIRSSYSYPTTFTLTSYSTVFQR